MPETQPAIEFEQWSSRIRRTIVLLAGVLSVFVGVGIPSLVLVLGVMDTRADLEPSVGRQAAIVSIFVYANPSLWMFEDVRLTALLRPDVDYNPGVRIRVVTRDEKTVLDIGQQADAPSILRTAPVRDGDQIVGAVVTTMSLGPIIARTGLAALGSVPLGVVLFLVVWLWPNRIYRFAFARLTEMEQRVRRTASNLNKAQEIANMGSWAFDPLLDRRLWSEHGLRLFGYRDGIVERPSMDWHDRVHRDDQAAVQSAYDRNRCTGLLQKLQYRLQRPDGTEVIIEERIEARLDADGRLVSQTGVFQDITERHALEAQFLQSQKMETVGHRGIG